MLEKKPKVIAIIGPTASGKTALSVEVAKLFNGEVISADSRQVYRGLDIGTAKITREEMSGIPHHLIDVVDVDTVFTAHDFRQLASKAIADILSQKKVPLVVGGTFFYLDQLRGTSGVAEVPANNELRKKLSTFTLPELRDAVAKFDPKLLETLDIDNPRRLMRAVEILTTLGYIPKSQNVSPYDWLIIALNVDKEILRTRYTARAEEWLDNGFLYEIKKLLANGVSRDRLTEIGFEYTLGLNLLEREIGEVEFIEQFVQKNWQYAKRQLTWLKRDPDILYFKPEQTDLIISTIRDFLKD